MLLCCACCCFPQSIVAQDNSEPRSPITMRLQIEWGGAEARLWRGSISVPDGEFSNLRLLGLDADQPGSFVHDKSRIRVEPRFSNRYSGVEVTVSANSSSVVEINLEQDATTGSSSPFRIPLTDLIGSPRTHELEDGFRLRVARTAGDRLRVRVNRDSMVFSPGESMKLEVDPHLLSVKPGTALRARFRLRRHNQRRSDMTDFLTEDLWIRTENVRVVPGGDAPPITDLEVPVPDQEGVYDLAIELSHRLPQVGTVARRKLQFVVVGSNSAPRFDTQSTQVAEFNPAEPNWVERLTQLPEIIPGTQRGPWSNVDPTHSRSGGSAWSHLQPEGWIAYALPVKPADVGKPHILDIEFPAEFRQDVGISVIDGKRSIASLDSGLSIGDPDLTLPDVSLPTAPTRHRVVFWPQTDSPAVLITNRSADGEIRFGRIRLEVFQQGLPSTPPRVSRGTGRKRIAALDGGRLREFFLAQHPHNDGRQIDFDDWQTFFEAGSRLVSYLRFAGYDGASISVLGDGSTLYPSELLHPTPGFDRGSFSGEGQDPYRKDVVEMLMRMFDREGLDLIPAVEFSTPLPELEKLLSAGQSTSVGIELVDASGRLGADMQKRYPGRAPYYNPLDPRVQLAMQHVVDELIGRYAHHACLKGLRINLSDVGYAHLPGTEWGFDQHTLESFYAYVAKTNPSESRAGFEATIARLRLQINTRQSTDLTNLWLQWRAEQTELLYRKLHQTVIKHHQQNRLYLSMVDLALTVPWQHHLRPSLSEESETDGVAAAMAELGIDIERLNALPNVVLMRPQRIASMTRLGSQAVNLKLMDKEVQQFFDSGSTSASQFMYESVESTLLGFAESGPPLANERSIWQSLPVRKGAEARRPYARSLAWHDDRIMMDGSDLMPMGQVEALRSFAAVYRELPDQPFELISFQDSQSGPRKNAPLVVRIARDGDQTWVYAVNVSPWTVDANFRWNMPDGCQVTALGQQSLQVQDLFGQNDADVTIEPYGLLALKFSSPDVRLLGCDATIQQVHIVKKHLRAQLERISTRIDQIRREPEPIPLLKDPGFESDIANPEESPWVVGGVRGGIVGRDTSVRTAGNSSLHMKYGAGPVWITSESFDAPETGRLIVAMKIRSNGESEAPLVLRLNSTTPGYRPLHRFEDIRVKEFRSVAIRFLDLPTDPGVQLQLQLEIVEPGEVWIDELVLTDKGVSRDEHPTLQRIIQIPWHLQRHDELGMCYERLGGYWPRFLLRHVPPLEIATRPPQTSDERENEDTEPPKTKMIDRMKKYLRWRF